MIVRGEVAACARSVWGLPPTLDLVAENFLQTLLLRLIGEGLIESAQRHL